MFFSGLLRFLTLFGPLPGTVLGRKSEKKRHEKTSGKVVKKIQAEATTDSGYRPCGPFKEFKKSANSPGLRPKGVT